jgi:O-succinylbenzoic acid--CoA ligase
MMRDFPDWLRGRALSVPDRIALIIGENRWTFARLDAAADQAARQLAELGVKDGDRIATLLEPGLLAAVLPHAAIRLGAALVPINTRLTTREIDWQIEDIQARLVIRDESMLEGVKALDVPLRLTHPADSPMAVIYTSGTTGEPKGATLTVGNFWLSADGSALNLGNYRQARLLACLSLVHVGRPSILRRSVI